MSLTTTTYVDVDADVGEDFVVRTRYDMAVITAHKVKFGSGSKRRGHRRSFR
ncbi:uncharacterized protein G2W53_029476 [Senna tora]|uniref:Uncharacterized protein n=1 Tax=Senna tora TaxID=362788 RepID=A0A834T7P5_9FABA|nr:uncharacterized protein G2W53_029476 [Senna tora]